MVEEAIGRKAVEVKAPAERPAEYFGKYVFDRDKMRKYLPKACFETLMNTMKNGSPLDRETADCVAAGMKQWAQDMGATHYTHWFQPLTHFGYNDPEQLKTFNLTNSKMGIHLDSNKVAGVDASTGSLGHGIPIAAGTAIAARVLGKDYYTYVVTGDGELDEGSNWEGLMTIRHYNLTNCITIVDRNHCMIDGNTEDVMKLEPLADKFVAFGFHTIVCEGNNIVSLCKAIDEAHKTKDKPTVIVADTIKGVGIKLTSGNYKWHYGAIDEEMAKVAAKDLDEYSAERIARCGKEFE